MKHAVKVKALTESDEHDLSCSCGWKAHATSEKFAKSLETRHVIQMASNPKETT